MMQTSATSHAMEAVISREQPCPYSLGKTLKHDPAAEYSAGGSGGWFHFEDGGSNW